MRTSHDHHQRMAFAAASAERLPCDEPATIALLWRRAASNDGECDRQLAPLPDSFELIRTARAARSRAIGLALVAAVAAVGRRIAAVARRINDAHERWRESRAARDAFLRLDDRTLRDIGFHRSEIGVLPSSTDQACLAVRDSRTIWTLPR